MIFETEFVRADQRNLTFFFHPHPLFQVHMYNDLYRYSIDKDEWKKITSPNSPGPRSAHQIAIMPTGTLFLFGGMVKPASSYSGIRTRVD